jgi:uncharacterized protein
VNDAQLGARLRDRNPWWRDPGRWTRDDETLRDVAEAPFEYRPAVLDGVAPPGLYSLVGPRRVGKSVELRRTIEHVLGQGVNPRSVVYFSCDGLSAQDLRRLFAVGQSITHTVDGARWWFIDEITAIGPAWSAVLKEMRDDTPVRRDCVVVTGSSARGLREATKNLAGRRGGVVHSDRVLLPAGFRSFCRLTGISGPDLSVVRPKDLFTAAGRDALEELFFWLEDLVAAWEHYLRVGGFPRAIRDFRESGDAGESFVRELWDVLRGDAIRAASMSDLEILAFLERLGESLTTPVNASSVAVDVGLGNHHRVNDRIEDLATSFAVWRCPQRIGGRPNAKAFRKVYFTDPLYARLAGTIDEQLRVPDASRITEQQVGLALARAIERDHPGAFATESRVMYARTRSGQEIDFVSPDFDQCFESKYVDRGWAPHARILERHCGTAALVTRRADDVTGDKVWAIPAPCLAWLLDADEEPDALRATES